MGLVGRIVEVPRPQLKDWIKELETRIECTFWACDYPKTGKVKNMVTCVKCQIVDEMKNHLKKGVV